MRACALTRRRARACARAGAQVRVNCVLAMPRQYPGKATKNLLKGLLRMPLRLGVRSYVTDHADFDDFSLPNAVGNEQSAKT